MSQHSYLLSNVGKTNDPYAQQNFTLLSLGLYYISNKYLQLSLQKSSWWVTGTGPTEGKAYCSSTDLFRVCGNFIKNGLYFKIHFNMTKSTTNKKNKKIKKIHFNTAYILCSKTVKHSILIKLKDFSSLKCAAQLTIRLIMVQLFTRPLLITRMYNLIIWLFTS